MTFSVKEKDALGRIFLYQNEEFADVVNGIVFKGKKVTRPEDLENAPPLSIYLSKEGIRSVEHDVIKYWKKESCYIALMCVENQSTVDPDMVFRDIGYLGTAYRDQLNRKEYGRYPVITLVLYFGRKRWNTRRKLSDCFAIPEGLIPWFRDYEMNVIEVCYLTDPEI